MRTAVLAALLTTTVALASCGLLIGPHDPDPSASAEACPLALLQGRLAPDGEGGALVVQDDGTEITVVWPDGYVVRTEPIVQLFDPDGNLIAGEGHVIHAGGGYSNSHFTACGEVSAGPA